MSTLAVAGVDSTVGACPPSRHRHTLHRGLYAERMGALHSVRPLRERDGHRQARRCHCRYAPALVCSCGSFPSSDALAAGRLHMFKRQSGWSLQCVGYALLVVLNNQSLRIETIVGHSACAQTAYVFTELI